MKPWKSDAQRGTGRAERVLQWGHGDEAVEEAIIGIGAGSPRTLQWGHGDEAVEEKARGPADSGVASGFNGATAMKPWKRKGQGPKRSSTASASMGPRR